jgi:hypothetical protein
MPFRLIFGLSIGMLISACGSTITVAVPESATPATLLERNINGFIVKSYTKYSPSGAILLSSAFSINKTANIITRTNPGDNDYYYYNSDGQIIKRAVIDDADPDGGGGYPNSEELYYQFNSQGLISKRTRDNAIDGDIDTTQTWEYNSANKLVKREYDDDNDGFTDTTITYTWSSTGQKLTRVITESDGNSTTCTYNYDNGTALLPISRHEDTGSDGSVDGTINYDYDSAGNTIRYSHLNGAGSLTSYWIAVYESAGGEVVGNLALYDFNIYN